ncbi:DUF6383 domain-containing protein [Parabacteroides sp. AM08-6]|uniref:DUF6383 domain-containing protein n=1 Tax=Parabacteroides sp. AM08-6 TaxID=2292053 RepID=UPI000EFFF644|nr:DUF6383 domain-containing protein [Parabacteroides sp. AM08-6]RHJ75651.1 hypothetical protein DW103_17555 [Parabacteroides sp. AM08-6]
MNKKFSTLMVGTLLAASTSAFAVTDAYKTIPTVTEVASGSTTITSGDLVLLKGVGGTNGIDLNGPASGKVKMDSLIWNTALTAGRSKAHVDSLLFTVTHKPVAQMYNGTPIQENVFTFASRYVKFAFAKPAAGKVANAFVKSNGELNEWILPEAYMTTKANNSSNNALGYAPYAIASRVGNGDATPDSVYVLATLKVKDANDNAAGTVQIVKIGYSDKLDAEIAQYGNYIKFDKGEGQLLEAASGSASNATHTLVTFSGFKVTGDLDFAVPYNEVEAALGYKTPSFAFGTAVSQGEENLLAAYNWEVKQFERGDNVLLKAVGAKQDVTNRDLYLTVDNACYDDVNTANFKLALDTLPGDGNSSAVPAEMFRNKDTYAFTIKANFTNDSISISTVKVPARQDDNSFVDKNGQTQVEAKVAVIAVKSFLGKNVLTTIVTNDDKTPAPLITPSEDPTKELENAGSAAEFTDGDVYNIYDMNKVKANGEVNPDYGKALIIDNMNNRTIQKFVKLANFDNTLPSHQWVVVKQKSAKVYSFTNRETGAGVDATAESGKTTLTNVKLYPVSGTTNEYTYGTKADTIKLEKRAASTLSKFDGYRNITKEEQMNKVFTLRFVSELLGKEAFVQQGADSLMMVTLDNKAKAAQVRFLQMGDSIKLGKLTIAPYAIKLGRYFLTYDKTKKVYRFTTKQEGEAEGEAPTVDDTFVLTKLIGGKLALVPSTTVNGGAPEKLAIDSKDGSAVKVALNSDLRHTFELTEPEAPIFAQVMPKTDTTLVDVSFSSVENLGWQIAVGADNFLYEGVPALKAGGAEYDKAAFKFQLDTAYIQRPGNTMPLYYITRDAVRGDSIPVPHEHIKGDDHVCPAPLPNDTLSGNYLFIMEDSLGISRENDLKYGYTYNAEYESVGAFAKLQMVKAKHIGDKLIVNPGRVTPSSMDTLIAGEIANNATVEQMQTQWLAGRNAENKALFAFRINLDNKDEYAIYNPSTRKYITYVNGFVVASEVAAFYNLKDKEGGNVANETIDQTASTVSVLAKNGAVEVVGAAGKKVVVSNMLGQVKANTVLTSDNATISVPAGIMIVAVDGEEAVKVIVK